MGTQERKVRERQEREDRILDVALRMLVESGYPGLTMDRVAESIEYSKGTVYQHFSCKEDIIAGVLCRTEEYETRVMEYAVTLSDCPREQLTAISLCLDVFHMMYPGVSNQQLLYSDLHIWNKADPRRRDELNEAIAVKIETGRALIEKAIGRKELDPARHRPADVLHGIILVSMGRWEMMRIGSCHEHGAAETHMNELFSGDVWPYLRTLQAFMDGLRWRPCSDEHDYDAFARGIFAAIPQRLPELVPFPAWHVAANRLLIGEPHAV